MYKVIVYRADGTRFREMAPVKLAKAITYLKSAFQFGENGLWIEIHDMQKPLEVLKEVKK